MTLVMIDGGAAAEDSRVSRSGGVPLVPHDLAWPLCATCDGPMQFLAQLLPDDVPELNELLLIFMCQNDAGMCDEWEPFEGGNRAFLVPPAHLVARQPPAVGVTRLEFASTLEFRLAALANGDRVLGFVGGEPDWIQNDETPACPRCGRLMGFVAQLEEGPVGMNFGGGGCGYAFACQPCLEAAFLWQCG